MDQPLLESCGLHSSGGTGTGYTKGISIVGRKLLRKKINHRYVLGTRDTKFIDFLFFSLGSGRQEAIGKWDREMANS